MNLKIASTTRLGSMCGSSSTMSGAGPPETGRVLEVGQQHLEEVLEVHQVAGLQEGNDHLVLALQEELHQVHCLEREHPRIFRLIVIGVTLDKNNLP